MLSINSLQHAIRSQSDDISSKRKLAEDLLRSAEQHEARDDTVNAQRDRQSAERYLRDIEGIEKTIAEYEADVEKRQLKAKDIEKQLDDLDQRFKRELEQLEKQKIDVVDVDVLMSPFPEAEMIRRKAKDNSVDNKIENLTKQHQKERDKLEREHDNLVN
jgi:hypothetical protein